MLVFILLRDGKRNAALFFFSSRRRHTRCYRDWSSDVCSSDLLFRDHAATLVDYGEDRLDEGWDHLLRLHEQRWDGAGGGAFRDPRNERLQRQFAGEMAKQKRLWLTTLDLDGQPAAAWYGFTSDDTVYFYQSGRAWRWKRESVGLVLMGLMIQRAIQQGYRAFDFLRGDDRYKHHWTPARRKT